MNYKQQINEMRQKLDYDKMTNVQKRSLKHIDINGKFLVQFLKICSFSDRETLIMNFNRSVYEFFLTLPTLETN